MKVVKKIFYLFLFFHCCFTATFVHAQKTPTRHVEMPEINCIDTKLPVTFSWINYEDPAQDVPAVVTKKIQGIITDFYLESIGVDSEEIATAKDCYFHTLRVPWNNVHLFIVILKTPLSYTHCKLFLYDSISNTVSKTTTDYNIWSMYSIDDEYMPRSSLYKGLRLNTDDICLVKKKPDQILVKRIKHDGTYNELEEITYHANGVSLDTVSFKSKILYEHEH